MDYRISAILHRRLSDGTKDPSDLSRRDRRNLQKFLDGSLIREKCYTAAVTSAFSSTGSHFLSWTPCWPALNCELGAAVLFSLQNTQ